MWTALQGAKAVPDCDQSGEADAAAEEMVMGRETDAGTSAPWAGAGAGAATAAAAAG